MRWPGRMRGAIMPSLIFWFFCIKAKEHTDEIVLDEHGYANVDELINN